ncbi:hypothetical protein, partial [Limnohabitans sp.]|uniref:hypothetical protein n=1 Tax=Limnohabitans sp. TaxID=1907725 RepID=UPI0037C036A3
MAVVVAVAVVLGVPVVQAAQAVVAGQSLQALAVVLPRIEPPVQSRLPGALRQAEAQTEAVALQP